MTKIGYRPFDIFVSIDFRYEKIFVGNKSTFQSVEPIKLFAVGCTCYIVRYINIPPSSVIVHAVPSVPSRAVFIGYTVNGIARNILTAAERDEQMGKVKANSFLGLQCLANIEVLEKRIAVVVVLEVGYDPIIKRSHLFLVGCTTGTNFVSKFFRMGIPQSISAVGKIRGFRFENEII